MRPTLRNLGQLCGRLRGPLAIGARDILSGSISGGDLPRASAIATRPN
jgi:hypothetical protein